MTAKNTTLDFDASTVKPSTATDPIPPGWYDSQITDAEVIATRGKGGGTAVKIEYTVANGEHKGRKFWGNYNTKNANAQTVEIGTRDLSSVCHAIGTILIKDVSVMVGKQLQVKVKIKPGDDQYDAKNDPKGYKPLEGAAAPSGPAGGPPPPPGSSAPPPPPGAAPTPPPPPVPAPPAAFPPAGWLANGDSGWFYEVANPANQLQEPALRALASPPPAPAAAPTPPPPPAPAPAPPAPVAFPPAGWLPNGDSGWFYEVANPANQLQEAALRAMSTPTAPPAPGGAEPPPWKKAPGSPA